MICPIKRAVDLSKKPFLLGFVLTSLAYSVGQDAQAWGQALPNSDQSIGQGRISPQDVTLQNHEAFEAQLRRDLPVGTTKDEVEAYLSRAGITHSFHGHQALVDKNTFYGILENLGKAGPFRVSLAIRIHLNLDDRVDRVWFRLDYL